MRFREFLLNEDRAYLGHRIGDVLTALSDLNQHAKGMGTRQVTATAEGVANQIRRILRANWKKQEMKYLWSLQKVGVAIMKAIEEKGDLDQVLVSAEAELAKLSGDLGMPVNNLASPSVPPPPPATLSPPPGGPEQPAGQGPAQQQQQEPPANQEAGEGQQQQPVPG